MKKKIFKVLSLFLSVIFLIGSVCAIPVAADTTATLTPTKMTYAHSHSTISGTNKGLFRSLWNNYCAVYAITLEADTDFDISAYDTNFTNTSRSSTAYLSSYENAGNLDFAHIYDLEDATAHNELATMLRNNIYINGMSIAEAMVDNTDYGQVSILVGITENKITIMVPVATYSADDSNTNQLKNFNNSTHGFYVGDFGSNPTAVDYTISITEGIEIGGVAVNPMKYNFTATNTSHNNTGDFEEDTSATLTPIKMTYAHSHSTISGTNKGLFRCLWNNYCAAYAIVLESDTTFDATAYDTTFDTSTDRSGTAYLSSYENLGKLDYANVYNKAGSDTHNELATMLRNNIYINGMSIAEAMVDNTDYTTMSVLVGISGNKITIMVPVAIYSAEDTNTNQLKNFNNSTHGFYVGDFGSDPTAVDYTITITEGIEIGGVAVKPMQYDFTATNTSHSDTGNFEAHTHTPDTPVNENELLADCTTVGSYDEVVYCSNVNCGAEISRTARTTNATGHTFDEVVSATEGDCCTNGTIAYKVCSVCEDKFAADADVMSTEVLDTIETGILGDHVWVPQPILTSACEEVTAIEYDKCSVCGMYQVAGEVVNEAPIIANHTFGEVVEATEGDCETHSTVAYKTCKTCEKNFAADALETETEALETIYGEFGDHNWIAQTPLTSACEDVEDIAYDKCDICGKYRVGNDIFETAPTIAGHTFGEVVEATQGDCKTQSTVAYKTCETCEKNFAADALETETKALETIYGELGDHDWVAQTPIVSECDGIAAVEYDKCAVCDKYRIGGEITEDIPTTIGHEAVGTDRDEKNHWTVCANCDENINVAPHIFGDWYDVEGGRQRDCDCGYEEFEETPEEPEIEIPDGWNRIDGKWYYYENNVKFTSTFIETNGYTYYVGANGVRTEGWITIDGDKYFGQASGILLQNRWFTIEGTTYYFGADCKMVTGLTTIGGNTYYFNENGVAVKDVTLEIEGETYYFNANGIAKKGWQTVNGKRYYVQDNGTLTKNGIYEINGYSYYFDENGVRTEGWITIDGDKYFGQASGILLQNRWYTIEGTTYYFGDDCKMATGLTTISNNTYYFNENGVAQKNVTIEIEGESYYFNANGIAKKGWQTVNGKRYYVQDNGTLTKNGIYEINGYSYYFDENGVRTEGWITIDGDKYFGQASGILLQNRWYTIDGNARYFGADCKMAIGLTTIDNNTYYFNENGVAVKDVTLEIEGETYYFNSNGICKKAK